MNEQAKVYLVRAGESGEDEEYALENNLAILGFQNVPSLEGAEDYDAIVRLVAAAEPGAKSRAVANRAGQLWYFAIGMKEGDIVVLPRKRISEIALGRVDGPYQHRQVATAFRHTRPVKWQQVVSRTAI